MDKVTRQCPQTTTFFDEKGEPKRYRTEVLPLTSLTPYRLAKPAHGTMCNIIWHLIVCTCCLFRRRIELGLFFFLFYSRRLHGLLCLVVNCCQFRSMPFFSIIFCLTDFMFSVYFGSKLSIVYGRSNVLLTDYFISAMLR